MEQSKSINIARIIIGLVLGVILSSIFFTKCQRTVFQKYDVPFTEYTTRTDTVFIPTVKRVTKVLKIPVPYKTDSLVYDTAYVRKAVEEGVTNGVSKQLVRRFYKDSVTMDTNLAVTYDAQVLGTLEKITLGVHDQRPTMIIRHDSTTNNYIPIRGFYTGATGGSQSFGPTLSYATPRHLFSVNYNLVPALRQQAMQGLNVSVQFRVGGKR